MSKETDLIFDEIEELADIDVEVAALPICETYIWYPASLEPGSAPKMTILQLGGPVPMDTNTQILAIYQNDEEIRVYCGLTKRPAGVVDEAKIRHKRYTFSKHAPIFAVETMPMPTMLTELASELQELREATVLKHDLEDNPHCVECKGTGYKVEASNGEADEAAPSA